MFFSGRRVLNICGVFWGNLTVVAGIGGCVCSTRNGVPTECTKN